VIWLTWRQFRTQAAAAVGALVVAASALVITGQQLVHLYNTTVAPCAVQGDCQAVRTAFVTTDLLLQVGLGQLLLVIPALLGMFWGAPLIARELETGTFRLAWTQSVTSKQWLFVKIGIVGLASIALTGLLSLMVTWWFNPIDRVNMNAFGVFDQRNIAPIGYAAFAFALGVTAGTLVGRTLPAMVATMVAFVATRVVVTTWLRPHLFAPVLRDFALNPASIGLLGPAALQPSPPNIPNARITSTYQPNIPNAWITSTQIVDKAGHALTTQILKADCPGIGKGGPGPAGPHSHGPASAAAQQGLHDCVEKVGATYHLAVTYQPADRYWAFQWYEMAIFFGLAVVLLAFAAWWIRYRVT